MIRLVDKARFSFFVFEKFELCIYKVDDSGFIFVRKYYPDLSRLFRLDGESSIMNEMIV